MKFKRELRRPKQPKRTSGRAPSVEISDHRRRVLEMPRIVERWRAEYQSEQVCAEATMDDTRLSDRMETASRRVCVRPGRALDAAGTLVRSK